jgi:hypothetical protein
MLFPSRIAGRDGGLGWRLVLKPRKPGIAARTSNGTASRTHRRMLVYISFDRKEARAR